MVSYLSRNWRNWHESVANRKAIILLPVQPAFWHTPCSCSFSYIDHRCHIRLSLSLSLYLSRPPSFLLASPFAYFFICSRFADARQLCVAHRRYLFVYSAPLFRAYGLWIFRTFHGSWNWKINISIRIKTNESIESVWAYVIDHELVVDCD